MKGTTAQLSYFRELWPFQVQRKKNAKLLPTGGHGLQPEAAKGVPLTMEGRLGNTLPPFCPRWAIGRGLATGTAATLLQHCYLMGSEAVGRKKEASRRSAQGSRWGLGPCWGEVERRRYLRCWEGKHSLRELCSLACMASWLACLSEVHKCPEETVILQLCAPEKLGKPFAALSSSGNRLLTLQAAALWGTGFCGVGGWKKFCLVRYNGSYIFSMVCGQEQT